MVTVLPPKVAEVVAGGLLGGPGDGPCGGAVWADSAVATNRRLVQTKKRFMVSLSLGTNPGRERKTRCHDCRTSRPDWENVSGSSFLLSEAGFPVSTS